MKVESLKYFFVKFSTLSSLSNIQLLFFIWLSGQYDMIISRPNNKINGYHLHFFQLVKDLVFGESVSNYFPN